MADPSRHIASVCTLYLLIISLLSLHLPPPSPQQKKEIGKFVFDQVLRRLSLPEKDKDYFGMEYEDDQKVPVRQLVVYNNSIILDLRTKI